MKTYSIQHHSERLETTAPTVKKAISNFRFRLVRVYGLSWAKAKQYDFSTIKTKEV